VSTTDRDASTAWLSQDAHDRLQAELEALIAHRPTISAEINARRQEGDLRENGGYHAAREEQGKMEGRIRQLSAMLENAEIVQADNGEHVSHGSVVAIRYSGDDEVERYLVGSIEERHDDLEVISPSSPLGEALIGSTPGDSVTFTAPTGAELRVEIVSVD